MKVQSISNTYSSRNRNFTSAGRRVIQEITTRRIPSASTPLPQPVRQLLTKLADKSAGKNLPSLAQKAEAVCKRYKDRILVDEMGKEHGNLYEQIVRATSALARKNASGGAVIDLTKPIEKQLPKTPAKLAEIGNTTIFKDGTKVTREMAGGYSVGPFTVRFPDGHTQQISRATIYSQGSTNSAGSAYRHTTEMIGFFAELEARLEKMGYFNRTQPVHAL